MSGESKIAVCFFGITRCLGKTRPSIEQCIIAPAKAHGIVRTFAHLYDLDRIDNGRSGESGVEIVDRPDDLGADDLVIDKPGSALDIWNFDQIAEFGDTWSDDFQSIKNLIHQLHSLHDVTGRAMLWSPDIYIFCRPDLRYLDTLETAIQLSLEEGGDLCILPFWQQHRGGYNDRFSVVRGTGAVKAYGLRIERALEFCASGPNNFHAERFLRYCLNGIPVRKMKQRAVRVRANGEEAIESFSPNFLETLHEKVHALRIGTTQKRLLHAVVNRWQGVADQMIYPSHSFEKWPGRPE